MWEGKPYGGMALFGLGINHILSFSEYHCQLTILLSPGWRDKELMTYFPLPFTNETFARPRQSSTFFSFSDFAGLGSLNFHSMWPAVCYNLQLCIFWEYQKLISLNAFLSPFLPSPACWAFRVVCHPDVFKFTLRLSKGAKKFFVSIKLIEVGWDCKKIVVNLSLDLAHPRDLSNVQLSHEYKFGETLFVKC